MQFVKFHDTVLFETSVTETDKMLVVSASAIPQPVSQTCLLFLLVIHFAMTKVLSIV